jgi:tRNA threonylcarbamoyladenosine biosynthesis protein TsaE
MSSDVTLHLPTAAETEALGRRLAALARPGDVILLEGPIGAGKAALPAPSSAPGWGQEEEVPSPTFTLVQVYEADGVEIWHADLYRLTHPDEVWELGLDDAFATAICLVEWPDRLGQHAARGSAHPAGGRGRGPPRCLVSGGARALHGRCA